VKIRMKYIASRCFFVITAFAALSLFSLARVEAGSLVAAFPADDSTDQLVVKLRDPAAAMVLSARSVDTLSATAGVTLRHHRRMSGNAQVMKLPRNMTAAEVEVIARRLRADPNVEYAEPDYRAYPMLTPNDTQYASQWALKPSSAEVGSANVEGAWDITQGSATVTAAVIDTGLVAHADIDSNILDGSGRVVAGYDFIGTIAIANDGDGRDANPSDPGDAVAANECGLGFPAENSSWHGTHVAGIIGANGDNGMGVAGINWNSKILPVRVLGKCGGFSSDIADGMRWAAGLAVTGVPVNANPAKVLNLSLGGTCSTPPCTCPATYQTAIDDVAAANVVVVVAAGNSNADVVNFRPANCTGVITVAAVNRAGNRASYSNFGSLVEIAAPGGDTGTGNGILSTLNTGLTAPVASPGGDTYVSYMGTSMATPHVVGVASLMLSLRPNMKPARTLAFLQQTARAFPGGSSCNTSLCGAGILDATAAVQAVNDTTLSANAGVDKTANPGASVALLGSGTPTSPVLITGYSWTQTAGTAVTLTNATSANASFTAPPALGALTFQLTVTDDAGLSASDSVNVTLNNVAPAITSIGNKTVTVGSTLDFTVTATDANGTTPTLSASNLPIGATFNAGTGVFSWPNAGPLGTYSNVTFSASDSVNSTSEAITITVQTSSGSGGGGGSVGGGGGGGCSLNRHAGFDPTLLLLALASLVMLRRRRIGAG